jgi:hypothetical protein
MDAKLFCLAIAPTLAGMAGGVWMMQGDKPWANAHLWVAPALFAISLIWPICVWQWKRIRKALSFRVVWAGHEPSNLGKKAAGEDDNKIKRAASVLQWRTMVADVFAEAKCQHKDPAELLVQHVAFNGLHPYLGKGTKDLLGPISPVRYIFMEVDRGAPMSTLQRCLLSDIDAIALHWGVDSPPVPRKAQLGDQ